MCAGSWRPPPGTATAERGHLRRIHPVERHQPRLSATMSVCLAGLCRKVRRVGFCLDFIHEKGIFPGSEHERSPLGESPASISISLEENIFSKIFSGGENETVAFGQSRAIFPASVCSSRARSSGRDARRYSSASLCKRPSPSIQYVILHSCRRGMLLQLRSARLHSLLRATCVLMDAYIFIPIDSCHGLGLLYRQAYVPLSLS